jgi:hypothetical protein
MRSRLIAVAMTVCIPAVSFAQKGGKAGPEGTPASSSSSGASIAMRAPSSRDLADLSPAALLVDKKKKASLADSTVNQLKALAKQFEERNKAFYAAYDSTRRWTLPISDNSSTRKMKDLTATAQQQMQSASPAEQEKMQSSMRDLRIMMTEFKVRRMTNSEEALKLIPEAQKKAAADLLSQQDTDLDKLIGAGRP